MTLTDGIVLTVILLIVGGAIAYIIKAKRSGKKCIGCPDSATCSSGGCNGNCSACSSCSSSNLQEKK